MGRGFGLQGWAAFNSDELPKRSALRLVLHYISRYSTQKTSAEGIRGPEFKSSYREWLQEHVNRQPFIIPIPAHSDQEILLSTFSRKYVGINLFLEVYDYMYGQYISAAHK
jgi:hypothetical protein